MIIQILLQILLGIIFLSLTLVIFTFPGFAILNRLKFKNDELLTNFAISTVLGFSVFTVVAYLLAFLHLRFLMWAFVPIGLFTLTYFRKDLLKLKVDLIKKLRWVLLSVLIVGSIGMVAVNAGSGWKTNQGIVFYSSHGHDGVWHLALIEHLQKNEFPFKNPEYAGNKLQNYHFFVDLLMSEMARLFRFSGLDIYFRFMPTFFAILFGISAFVFVREWARNSKWIKEPDWAGIWAMIFVYFCGSFGYLVTIPRNGNILGESTFWVSQTQSVLGNPPHASAFIIVTIFFYCLINFLKTKQWLYFILCVFLGGAVIEFKVYGGVLILGGLLVISIWEGIFRRNFKTLLLFISTLIFAFAIYFPNSQNSQDFLLWHPWYFIRTMVVAGDRLNWLDLELRRQTYIVENNWKRVIQLEVTAFLIFLFGNLGMRFLGFWTIYKQFRENIFKNTFNIFFLSITVAAFTIPVFFVQKGVVWNAIQFNQYFLLFFGYLAALASADLISRLKLKSLKIALSVLIIILAVPTQIGLLQLFYSSRPLSIVSNNELKALEYLKTVSRENEIILTAPFEKYEIEKYQKPFPIHTWYDTGYVAAFSGRETLLADEEQVNIMGYDAKKSTEDRKKAFESKDPGVPEGFFRDYGAEYLYLAYGQNFEVDEEALPITKLFENEHAAVYKINK